MLFGLITDPPPFFGRISKVRLGSSVIGKGECSTDGFDRSYLGDGVFGVGVREAFLVVVEVVIYVGRGENSRDFLRMRVSGIRAGILDGVIDSSVSISQGNFLIETHVLKTVSLGEIVRIV